MKEYFVDTQGTNGVTVKYAHDMFKVFLMSEGIPANKVVGVSEFRRSLVSHNVTYTKTAAPANKADAELVDDYAKPSRNRIKGKGIKTNDQQVMTKPDDIYKQWELLNWLF